MHTSTSRSSSAAWIAIQPKSLDLSASDAALAAGVLIVWALCTEPPAYTNALEEIIVACIIVGALTQSSIKQWYKISPNNAARPPLHNLLRQLGSLFIS